MNFRINSTIGLLVVTMVLISSAEAVSQKLPKVLILTGNGNEPNYKAAYPPWKHEFQNNMVIDILKDIAVVDLTTDLNLLATPALDEYDLIISNSIFLTPTSAQLDGLYAFVANGKSYLTLHCGILSLLNWKKYEEFIGGIFIGGPSTVPAEFNVTTANIEFWGYQYSFRDSAEHPISTVTDDFVIRDELYYFQPSTPDFHVIARAENLPVMWWHPLGKGRVMSLTLGHDEFAKANPGYQELLRNGVKWLTGIPLIFGEQPRTVSTRKLTYDNFITLQAFLHTDQDQSLHYRIEHNSNPDLFTVQSTPKGNINLKLHGRAGDGSFVVSVQHRNGPPSKKKFDIRVVADGSGNVAAYHGNTALSSSNENTSAVFRADNVLDENPSTRWSSAPVDSAWLTIDLKKEYRINKMVLRWEASYASDYTIEGSPDGQKWSTLSAIAQGDGDVDTHEMTGLPIRFIRINMMRRANNKWGYSLYEVAAYQE